MLAPLRWPAMSMSNDPDVTTSIHVVAVPGAEPVLLDVTGHELARWTRHTGRRGGTSRSLGLGARGLVVTSAAPHLLSDEAPPRLNG
jgi:hypothetical protein